MGNVIDFNNLLKYTQTHKWKQDEPTSRAPLKYDPQFGFKEERREKNPLPALVEEMDSIGIHYLERDACSHYSVVLRSCLEYYWPFVWNCNGFKNELGMCYRREREHDMKEFERERRLNRRERLLAEKAARAAA